MTINFVDIMDVLAEIDKQQIDCNPYMNDGQKLCWKLMIDLVKDAGKQDYIRSQYNAFWQNRFI